MLRKLLLVSLVTFSISSLNAQTPLNRHWTVTADYFGSRLYFAIDLDQQGDKLTGKTENGKLEGTTDGQSFHFLVTDSDGGAEQVKGTVQNGTLHGDVTESDPNSPVHPSTYTFTASLRPARPSTPPQRHDFNPTVFYRQYSPFNPPVLTVNPGDTIHTMTVDAGGVDDDGVHRGQGGNPETGPFYIESAMPGDTLVVHVIRLRLNRDDAGTDDSIVESALNSSLAVRTHDNNKNVRWHLDPEKGIATPMDPSPAMAHFSVPLHPMLGCIATAVSPSSAPPG